MIKYPEEIKADAIDRRLRAETKNKERDKHGKPTSEGEEKSDSRGACGATNGRSNAA
jgi:hypothetical protein